MLIQDMEQKTEVQNGSLSYTVEENDINKSFVITTLCTSDDKYLAYLVWVGKEESTSTNIYQPGILSNLDQGYKSLSYDGRINYSESSELIVMPDSGGIYEMNDYTVCYFNNYNPELYDIRSALDENNKSIRMNNISIFNSDHSQGIMMDFRASMEGSFNTEGTTGFVKILATIDEIN